MTRDQILEALAHPPAPAFGGRAVDDHAERIDGLGIDEDAHLDEIAVAIADLVIVEARIAAADRFEPIVEIEHDFVERQFVRHLRAAADIGEILLDTAALLAQLEDRAEIYVGAMDHRFDPSTEEHTSELQSL